MALNPFSALAAKIYAGLFGGALALVAVQTVRIDGLWFITGLEEKLKTARTDLATERTGRADDRKDWAHQVAAATAARKAAEQTSKEIATDAQASHESLLADNAGLREYIASHRLQSGNGTGAAASASTADDIAAGLPETAAAGTLVAASEADLHVCDADYAYAVSAYEFGQGLIASGLAK
ncbi:MAG: hypothetical protein DI555_06630 [Novosphingobium pentaromativorans]|uniref:Uncharacterized protein n=1 Tax=Novosphingobium pentaromativorans TaxID=205844 RepID=A0A2W5NTI2_9SPHN|nr:MAG: hypothetical protein DI555_06630 [Novosphingobium pentaromativorans]